MTQAQKYDFFQTMWQRGMEESTRVAITDHELNIMEQFFEDLFNEDAEEKGQAKVQELEDEIDDLNREITELIDSRDEWQRVAKKAVEELEDMTDDRDMWKETATAAKEARDE